MNINNPKIKINAMCFYCFWGILMIGKGMGLNNNNSLFLKFAVMSGIFATFCLLSKRWNRKSLIKTILLLLLGILVFVFSGNKDAILSFICIGCLYLLDLNHVLKFTLIIRGVFFFLKTCLGMIGYLDPGEFISYDIGSMRIRYMFGYSQPNTAHYELFIICSLLLLVYGKKIKNIHSLILLSFNFLLYSYTNSRTGVFMVTAILLAGWLYNARRSKLMQKIISKCAKSYFLLITGVSVFVCILVRYGYLIQYGTFSSRFITANRVMENYSLSLFGQEGVVTDFGFIYLLYANGVVYFLIYILFNYLLVKYFAKNKMTIELIVLVMYGFYTLMESYSGSILMNISLLFVPTVIYCNHKWVNKT